MLSFILTLQSCGMLLFVTTAGTVFTFTGTGLLCTVSCMLSDWRNICLPEPLWPAWRSDHRTHSTVLFLLPILPRYCISRSYSFIASDSDSKSIQEHLDPHFLGVISGWTSFSTHGMIMLEALGTLHIRRNYFQVSTYDILQDHLAASFTLS